VQRRLSEFKGFVFDIDGVLKLGDKPIKGAAEAITFLQHENRKVAILTNNATRSRKGIVDEMKRIGINVGIDEVFGSACGAARFIKHEFGGGKAFVIGERGLREELKAAGIKLLPASKAANADFVVVGLDRTFNYKKLDAALTATMNGAMFIATNEDARLPIEKGAKPGAGCMVAALSTCAKKKPDVVIGKPHPYLLEMAIEAMGLKKSELVMVGDGIETDIAMANAAGVYSVLVLTGNAPRKAELARLPRELKPSHVLNSVSELPSNW